MFGSFNTKVGYHLGALHGNMLSRRHQIFGNGCRYSRAIFPFLVGCNQNIMNAHIAIKLVRVVVHVLGDAPPSVPPRDVPLASVLKSK